MWAVIGALGALLSPVLTLLGGLVIIGAFLEDKRPQSAPKAVAAAPEEWQLVPKDRAADVSESP